MVGGVSVHLLLTLLKKFRQIYSDLYLLGVCLLPNDLKHEKNKIVVKMRIILYNDHITVKNMNLSSKMGDHWGKPGNDS